MFADFSLSLTYDIVWVHIYWFASTHGGHVRSHQYAHKQSVKQRNNYRTCAHSWKGNVALLACRGAVCYRTEYGGEQLLLLYLRTICFNCDTKIYHLMVKTEHHIQEQPDNNNNGTIGLNYWRKLSNYLKRITWNRIETFCREYKRNSSTRTEIIILITLTHEVAHNIMWFMSAISFLKVSKFGIIIFSTEIRELSFTNNKEQTTVNT